MTEGDEVTVEKVTLMTEGDVMDRREVTVMTEGDVNVINVVNLRYPTRVNNCH